MTKEEKRLYDIEYRRKNLEKINAKKRVYNVSPAGRAMQKRRRDKQKLQHLEYCRQQHYREWKKEYDEIHRAKVFYGEFWECMILVEKIHKEVVRLVPDTYERRKMRGIIARSQAKRAMKRSLMFGWQYNWSHVIALAGRV